MIKKFLLLFLCILISNAAVFADNSVLVKTADDVIQVRTAEMTDKIKNQRSDIYNSLNLTSEQIVKIKEIDNDFYKNIEPKLKRMVFLTKKIEYIAYSDNCSKKAVNDVKREFKAAEKEIVPIKNHYEKEFKGILTSEQKAKYRLARKEKRAQMKKELKNEIEKQKNATSATQ